MNKTKINLYKKLWEYLLQHGMKTITIIDEENSWDFRVFPHEYSVKETFYHTVQAIYEDASRWFMDEFKKFTPLGVPSEDLTIAVNHMIYAFEKFDDEEFSDEMIFQWGKKRQIRELFNRIYSIL